MRALLGLPEDRTFTCDEIISTSIHPIDRAHCANMFARAIEPAGPGSLHEEIRVTGAGGLVRWLEIKGETVFADGAACRGAEPCGCREWPPTSPIANAAKRISRCSIRSQTATRACRPLKTSCRLSGLCSARICDVPYRVPAQRGRAARSVPHAAHVEPGGLADQAGRHPHLGVRDAGVSRGRPIRHASRRARYGPRPADLRRRT